MSVSKKLLQAAAGAAGGAGLDIPEVFSSYVYTGNGTAGRTITNNIDISTEGGLIWTKSRSSTYNHTLGDTENGVNKYLYANTTAAIDTSSAYYSAFNTNGYVIGDAAQGFNANELNANSVDYVSWTFRKAPKFFDVVTYSGDGNAGRTVSHNLGSDVGMLIVKRTDAVGEWMVWHKDVAAIDSSYALQLQSTNAAAGYSSSFNSTAPTSTEFTLGNNSKTNNASGTYVAYLFAHNNSDGDFGPDGSQDIIKCGTCSGETGSNRDIDLGFEPQFIITKAVDTTGDWRLLDTMRGFRGGDVSSSNPNYRLEPNTSDAESIDDTLYIKPNGFYVNGLPGSGDYIYMAIRRGPLAQPTSATNVFAVDSESTTSPTPPSYNSGFPVDMFLSRRDVTATDSWYLYDRLRKSDVALITDSTAAEFTAGGAYSEFDRNDGIGSYTGTVYSNKAYGWMWKRAPSYFDVVAYTGTGLSSVNTVSHNLGVAPEMIWAKRRSGSGNWAVYHSGLNGGTTPEQYSLFLNTTGSEQDRVYWNDTAPTSTTFQVTDFINGSGDSFIAYLFATLAGISKVGSYTGNGSAMTIDCGFSSGARFVLIKRTDTTDNWYVWDSVRGIVSGTEPYIRLNTTQSETTGQDYIDPHSSGFALPNDYFTTNGATFIFYAIA